MPYTVAGTLKLPESGKPASGVNIKFKSLLTLSPLIQQMESEVTTSGTGAYSVALEFSTYAVWITLYNNKPFMAGEITVNSQTAVGLDLPTLLNGGQYEPATPEWILQIQAWMLSAQTSANTASAQASQASSSAQAAADSAARASEISGLSTVAEAIGLAALPLPDVWAPLSDSLRLILGYGRDVLVGEDVVARMVNFSRNSVATYIGKDGTRKTAAVNEPRFEREGLLIEGQSTNYLQNSEYYADYLKSNITVAGKVLTRSVTTGESYLNLGTHNLPTGKVTVSAAYKKSKSVNFSAFDVYCESFSPKDIELVNVKEVGDIVIVSATVDADFSGGPAGVFLKIFMGGDGAGSVHLEYVQMEALPFASSHIPTNGAAATRAADFASIPNSGNLSAIPATVAATVNFLGNWAEVTGARRRVYFCGDAYTAAREATTQAVFSYSGDTSVYVSFDPSSVKNSLLVFFRDMLTQRIYQDKVLKVSAGVIQFAEVGSTFYIGSSSTAEQLFGHIRNLRVWHHPLTNEQIKAIA